MEIKQRILKIQHFIDDSRYVEFNENELQSYDIKTKTFKSILLNNLSNPQKALIFKYVGNHNIQFTKLDTEVLKQLITLLNS